MKNRRRNSSGVIQGILAYLGDKQVGCGWVTYDAHFCQEVTLIGLDGRILDEGTYILVPSKEKFLTVINWSVH